MIKFITAEQRMAQTPKINVALFGVSGIGKTSQLKTLDPKTTLFLDLEAGSLAVQEWGGDMIDVRKEAANLNVHPWKLCRALACVLGGADPAVEEGPYSQSAYDTYCKIIGGPDVFEKYKTVFVDSMTVASRWSFQYWGEQPEALNSQGEKDTRGQYGAHGRDMVEWLTVLQHQPKSIVVVGILDEKADDFNRTIYEPQIVGAMAGRELPGIFDQVITMAAYETEAGTPYRAFVCQTLNPNKYPAKDRSGNLDMLEPPDLGKLLEKVTTPKKSKPLETTMPTTEEGDI